MTHLDVPFSPIPQTETIKSAIKALTASERVPIVDDKGNILNILSQTMVLKYLASNVSTFTSPNHKLSFLLQLNQLGNIANEPVRHLLLVSNQS
jgi:hypothetical protein